MENVNRGPFPAEVALQENPEMQSIEGIYLKIRKAEQAPADPAEIITFGLLTDNSPELAILVSLGSDPKRVKQGRLTRQELLAAGYTFNNVIGGGEKPIIKSVIDGIDYGRRQLLTDSELKIIQNYQSRYPEVYSSGVVPLEELRQDMLSFLLSTPDLRPYNLRGKVNLLRMVRHEASLNYELSKGGFPGKNRLYQRLIDAYWSYLIQQEAQSQGVKLRVNNYWSVTADAEKKFMDTQCKDIYPWDDEENFLSGVKARGVTVRSLSTRYRALNGVQSPFLDSGFHFRSNPDVTIIEENGQVYRLNMVNFHLALKGLSEMGESVSSYDQHYMAIGEYVRVLYPKTPEEKTLLHKQEQRKWQLQEVDERQVSRELRVRMTEHAYNWARSNKAPLGMRILANLVHI